MAWLAASVFQVVINGRWSGACCAWASTNCPGRTAPRPASVHPPAWAKVRIIAVDAASPASMTAYAMVRMAQQILKTIKI